MKKTTSLCISKTGLINPEAIDYIVSNHIEDVIVFIDGTEEAFQYLLSSTFYSQLGAGVRRIGLGKTPLFELRVINVDGTISRPNYVYSEDSKVKWICDKVCAPHMEIHASTIGSTNGTQALLDRKQTGSVCYMAHKLWTIILQVEDHMGFPAAVIAQLMYMDHLIYPKITDIEKLRKETGIASLAYSQTSDILSVDINDDSYVIKLSVLNEIYAKLIIPFFENINGRTMRLRVSIKGLPNFVESPLDMTYEFLGRIIEDMRLGCRERKITTDSPIDPVDLLPFAKKVKIDEKSNEACIWVDEGSSVSETALEHKSFFVRRNVECNEENPNSVEHHLQIIESV